jgi:hypothetical protein
VRFVGDYGFARAGALAVARTDRSDLLRARSLAMLLRRRTGNEDCRMSGGSAQLASSMAARAAARRAIGTRKGEQLT